MMGTKYQAKVISDKEYDRLFDQKAKDGSRKYFRKYLNHHLDDFTKIIDELKERYTTVKYYATRTTISGIYNYHIFYTNKK